MSKFSFKNYSQTYFFNTCFDKNQLKNLVSWFIKQCGDKNTIDFLETLKQIGFHQATMAGVSLGFDDLEIPLQKSLLLSQAKADISLFDQQSRSGNLTNVEKSQRMISTWNDTSEILRKTAVQQFKNTNQLNPVYMMAFSGARGNISQVRQLVAMRGLMADPQGVILEFPIQSNFREGLTVTEYLISCFGARKGLVDTALRTATSGYLTRRLVDAAQHVIVSIKDCGTTQGFRLRNKDLEQHLIGRVLSKDLIINDTFQLKKNQKISPSLAKLISKNVKEVFVRSPLSCQAENSICQLCYGWNLAHGTLVSIGEAVGVIAAQSIGEPGTQLTMRTFHTGGVGVFSDQNMKYFLAPYDGIIEYPESLPGHFVRTPHGKIVYMLKNTNTISQHSLLILKSIEQKKVNYVIQKQELPPGSLLLVRQGELVKAGQILAQASQFKKSKQKMPESTHPIFSTLDGEIFLESMTILKQKQFTQKTKKIKKSQKKDKQLGPDIRTLKGLGSFWVLSSENQQQFHTAKTILRTGDLVSSKTRLFQYNFYISKPSIFYTINKKPCLGENVFSIPLEQINFHKLNYSMVLKNSHVNLNFINKFKIQNPLNQKEIIFFNKKRFQNYFIWFPSGSVLLNSAFLLNFLFYSEIKNKGIANYSFLKNGKVLTKISTKEKKIIPNNSWFYGSLFYFTKKIQRWQTKSPFYLTNSSNMFLLNLKKNGLVKSNLLVQYCHNNNSSHIFFKYPKQIFSLIQQQSKSLDKFDIVKNDITIQTKFFYYTQKHYLNDFVEKPKFFKSVQNNKFKPTQKEFLEEKKHTDFLKIALKKAKSSISTVSKSSIFVQEKNGWLYIPVSTNMVEKNQLEKNLILSEQGKIFNHLLFFNFKVSIKKIAVNKIKLLKDRRTQKLINTNWYSRKSILNSHSFLLEQKNLDQDTYLNLDIQSRRLLKNQYKCFLYYKKNKDTSLKTFDIIRPKLIQMKHKKENTTEYFFFVSVLKEFSLPKKQELLKKWNSLKNIKESSVFYNYKKQSPLKINSPLLIKQENTFYRKNQKLRKNFQLMISVSKSWFTSKNIFKVLINLNSRFLFKKINQKYLVSNNVKNYTIPFLGINLFLYNFISLPENISFNFDIFEKNWVFPNNKITTCFIRVKKSGEFRHFKSKTNTTITSVLTPQNIVTINFTKLIKKTSHSQLFNKKQQNLIGIGNVVRSGTEIFPGIGLSVGGVIINKTSSSFIIRLGIPFLASARGIIHIFQNDLVQKNDLLITLKSRRLQTEDIVQGIPKIEQLFEARETQGGTIIRNSMHSRLNKYFLSSLKSEKISINNVHNHLSKAVNDSLNKIQFFLVQSILQAYSSQGVKISQKHIEIIVCQMTTRVRILAGGDSGLLAGELIQFTKIQKLNNKLHSLRKRPAIYKPIIIGITKSVLQSESFLLSASFQEVSRVLVRSALTKKTDFLRGLHENVIVGQLVPTGTGLISVPKTKDIYQKELNL